MTTAVRQLKVYRENHSALLIESNLGTKDPKLLSIMVGIHLHVLNIYKSNSFHSNGRLNEV